MTGRYLLSTSILSADFSRLGEQIHEAEAAGADWVHVDVMDGHFVPNLTMGAFIVETCRRITSMPLDVHLMVDNPEQMLEMFAQAGASGLTVQLEACHQLHRTLLTIRQLGCRAGVAINPGTPAAWLEPVLHLTDLILVLTVNPGYSGQQFLPEVLPKIAQVRRMVEAARLDTLIEVDGGMSPETLPRALEAGAQVFVSATAIFKNPAGIAQGVKSLRALFPL